MSWKEVNIGALGRVITGKTPPTGNRAFYDGEYPFVTPTDLDWQSYIVRSTHSSVTQLARDRNKNQFIPVNSMMFTCIGNTIGKCGLSAATCLTNQQINSVVPSDEHDPRFVYYLLNYHRPEIRSLGLGNGAAQPIINKTTFSAVKVLVPPTRDAEERIAVILSAYDDLIENNRRRIVLLEEAARQLYDEWFVRFRFPGHEHVKVIDGVPEGWEQIAPETYFLSHIGGGWGQDEPNGQYSMPAYVVRGTDIPDLKTGGTGGAGIRYDKETTLKSRYLDCNDIVFEVSGGSIAQPVARTLLVTAGLLARFSERVICASFCKRLRFRSEADAVFFHFHAIESRQAGRILEYQKESASSLKNFNWKDFLSSYIIVCPPSNLRERFRDEVKDLMELQEKLARQCGHSAKARDLLLPRLMSEAITV